MLEIVRQPGALLTAKADRNTEHKYSKYGTANNLTTQMGKSSWWSLLGYHAGALSYGEVTASYLKIGHSLISFTGVRSPLHRDVIKWKQFPRYWPFVWGIHRSPVNSPHKGQWLGAFMFSLICAWINSWVNNREAGDLRRHRAHYDVIVMNGMEAACSPFQ